MGKSKASRKKQKKQKSCRKKCIARCVTKHNKKQRGGNNPRPVTGADVNPGADVKQGADDKPGAGVKQPEGVMQPEGVKQPEGVNPEVKSQDNAPSGQFKIEERIANLEARVKVLEANSGTGANPSKKPANSGIFSNFPAIINTKMFSKTKTQSETAAQDPAKAAQDPATI